MHDPASPLAPTTSSAPRPVGAICGADATPPDDGVARAAARMAAVRRDFCLYRLLSPGPREAVDAEKRHFFAARARGEHHAPRFAYPPLDLAALEHEAAWLDALRLDDSPLGRLLEDERTTLLLHLDLLRACGGDAAEFTRRALRAFPAPTIDDVRAATDAIARIPPKPRATTHSAGELAAMARAHLDALGLAAWRIEVDPHLLSVLKVETATRLIQIKAGVAFDELDVVSLLRHEIEGHAVRAEHGFALGHDFLGTGVGDEVELDEGIAVYLEEAHGGLVGRRALEVCARVVAAHAALEGDFAHAYDAVERLAPSIGPDLLFQMVARVKRGLADTDAPGGWPKDAQYFLGWRKVRALMDAAADDAARTATWARLMRARVGWRGLDAAEALAREVEASRAAALAIAPPPPRPPTPPPAPVTAPQA